MSQVFQDVQEKTRALTSIGNPSKIPDWLIGSWASIDPFFKDSNTVSITKDSFLVHLEARLLPSKHFGQLLYLNSKNYQILEERVTPDSYGVHASWQFASPLFISFEKGGKLIPDDHVYVSLLQFGLMDVGSILQKKSA